MSKKIKALIFGGVAVVVLAAIAIVLTLTAPKSEESSLPSSNAIPLIDELYSDAESLYVKNATGEYTIENVGEDLFRIAELNQLTQ